MAFDLAAAVSALRRTCKFKSILLWALAAASAAGAITLEIATTLSPTAFAPARQIASPWLVLACIVLGVLAVFKSHQERRTRFLRFVALPTQCFWHPAKQPSGHMYTQIGCSFSVYNMSDRDIELPEVRLVRPRYRAPNADRHVMVRHPNGNVHGSYPILAHTKTEASVHIMVREDLSSKLKSNTIKLKIADHSGNWYPVRVTELRHVT